MSRKIAKTVAAAAYLVAGALTALSASAASPVQWSGNGHWYQFVAQQAGETWEDAKAAAAAMTYGGMQGYLATITSAGENDFLKSPVNSMGQRGWVAGTDKTKEGTWVWDAGPEAGTVFWQDGTSLAFTAWHVDEPNNGKPPGQVLDPEHYLVINQPFLSGWNDAPGNYAGGFYVEFSAAPVPEAPLPLMWAAGAAAVLLWVRRKGNAFKSST